MSKFLLTNPVFYGASGIRFKRTAWVAWWHRHLNSNKKSTQKMLRNGTNHTKHTTDKQPKEKHTKNLICHKFFCTSTCQGTQRIAGRIYDPWSISAVATRLGPLAQRLGNGPKMMGRKVKVTKGLKIWAIFGGWVFFLMPFFLMPIFFFCVSHF